MEPSEEESPYCVLCDSCGESGCCHPSNCLAVRCKYGEYNLKEYKHLLDENEAYRSLFKDIQKFLAWLGNDCSSLESRQLSEKITKVLETDFSVQ